MAAQVAHIPEPKSKPQPKTQPKPQQTVVYEDDDEDNASEYDDAKNKFAMLKQNVNGDKVNLS